MRLIVAAPIVAVLLLCPGPLSAQAAGAKTPGAVARYVAQLGKECRGYGGSPGHSPDLIRSADLTGDRMPDYIVNVGRFNCDGAASALGARQSGAAIAIFVGAPGNAATEAFNDIAYDVRIEPQDGKPRAFITLAGRPCGQKVTSETPFSDYKGCELSLVWDAAKRHFKYAPVSQARPLR